MKISNKYLYLLIPIIVIGFFTISKPSKAEFYRSGSNDTSYTYGQGIDGQGKTELGWGYNIEPLADYGYTNSMAKPVMVNATSIAKNSASIRWDVNYISQSKVLYGSNQNLGFASNWLSYQQGSQRYNLTSLDCGKVYYYQVIVRDVAGNQYQSDINQFKTLSCSLNILEDEEFDIITNDGQLEITYDLSAQTSMAVAGQGQYRLGVAEGSVLQQVEISLQRSGFNLPKPPSITTGLYPLTNRFVKININQINNQETENLLKPGVLEIPYYGSQTNYVDIGSFKIAHYDDSDSKWRVVPTNVDTDNVVVRAEIRKPGIYQIVGKLKDQPALNIKDGFIYQEPTGTKVYLVKQGIKHYISSLKIMNSWGFKPIHVIKESDLSRVPLGDDLKFRDGSVLKVGAATYYYIDNGNKRLIINDQVFQDLGFTDAMIYEVSIDQLDRYPTAQAIVSAITKPDGVLIKYQNSNKVYLVENGEKRWIIDEQAFRRNHYRWDWIVTVPVTEIYPDGELIL